MDRLDPNNPDAREPFLRLEGTTGVIVAVTLLLCSLAVGTTGAETRGEPADEVGVEAADPRDLDVLFVGERAVLDVTALEGLADATDPRRVVGNITPGDRILVKEGTPGGQTEVAVEATVDENLTVTVPQTSDDGPGQTGTDSLRPASHFLHVDGVDVAGTEFEVREQRFDVEFDGPVSPLVPETVLQIASESWAEAAARSGVREETLSLSIDAAGLSHGELAAVFGRTEGDAAPDEPVTLHDIPPESTVPVDFSGIDPGIYEFTVDVHETAASGTAVVEQTGPVARDVALVDTEMRTQVGDVVDIELDSQGVDEIDIELSVERERVQGSLYRANVTVAPPAAGQRVTLRFNTFAAGTGEGVFSTAEPGADVRLNDETVLDAAPGALPAKPVEVTADVTDRTNQLVARDRGTIGLENRSLDEITTHVAPLGTEFGDRLDQLESFLLAETPTDRMSTDGSRSDVGVALVSVSGVFGYLTTDEGTLNTERGLNFTATRAGNSASQPLTAADPGFDIVPLETENRLFIQIEPLAPGTGLDAGETYELAFSIDGDENPYLETNETESVTTRLRIAEARTEIGLQTGSDYAVTPDEEAVVHGQSNLAPGTELTVSVAGRSFFRTNIVPVSESGEFLAEFDMTNRTGLDEIEVVPPIGDVDIVSATFADTPERQRSSDTSDGRTETDNPDGGVGLEELQSRSDQLEAELDELEEQIDELERSLDSDDSAGPGLTPVIAVVTLVIGGALLVRLWSDE